MTRSHWPLAAVLVIGAILATAGVRAQRSLALRVPLAAALPAEFEGYRSRDVEIPTEELTAAGVSDYLSRMFVAGDSDSTAPPVYLYVGYYDRQTSGRTIHSPRNCLPGGGWEPLTNTLTVIETPAGPVAVNRYLIQKGRDQALVLYWYQGRGRVESNEYAVKWDLVRDAALRRRSEEALVRIVVPMTTDEDEVLRLATAMASRLVPAVALALPA